MIRLIYILYITAVSLFCSAELCDTWKIKWKLLYPDNYSNVDMIYDIKVKHLDNHYRVNIDYSDENGNVVFQNGEINSTIYIHYEARGPVPVMTNSIEINFVLKHLNSVLLDTIINWDEMNFNRINGSFPTSIKEITLH